MITFLIGLVCLLSVVYFALRIMTIQLAKREGTKALFFITMKLGRIKRRVRNGKIIAYFANLQGMGHHINEKTGEILDGEEGILEGNNGSFWWRFFGVRWIGLDSVFVSPIEKYNLKGDASGKLEKVTEIAESLYFQGSYMDILLDAESKGGIKVDMTFRVMLETVHAGKTSMFKFFLPLVLDPIKGKQRDFIASKTPNQLLSKQYAGKLKSSANEEFVALILSLNRGVPGGNPGLEETVGQSIKSINVLEIGISEEDLHAIEAKKKAELAGNAQIVESEKAIIVAKNKATAAIEEARGKAEAKKLVTDVDVSVLARKVEAMKGDVDAYARVASSDALGQFQGNSLVVGNASTILPLSDESKKGETK